MAGIITFEVVGIIQTSRFIGRVATEIVGDLRPYWRSYFAPTFYGDLQKNWASEGGLVGGWAALEPTYAAWKARNFPGRGILVLKKTLRVSLTWANGRPRAGGIWRSKKDHVLIGTSVPHGQWHQKKRPFLFFTGRKRYGDLLQRYVTDSIRATGRSPA